MLIVLEGPDNAGKTWLAERLANETDGEIRHWGPIKEHPLEEYEWRLQDYVPGSRQTIICDRLHLGEEVYGPLYRHESRLDPVSWFHIEAFLNSRGAVLVHLSASLSLLRQRHADEGEDFLKVEHLPQVVQEYGEVVAMSHVERKLALQTTEKNAVRSVLDAARVQEVDAAPIFHLTEGRYIGASLPTVLLVGEQRNLDGRGFTSPFVPLPATSGHYLFYTLHQAEVDLRGLGVINAVEDEEHLVDLWQMLQCPPIVTLGGVAHRIVSNLGLTHGAVPHPQWVRRFAHDRGGDYAKLIKRAWDRGGVHRLPESGA